MDVGLVCDACSALTPIGVPQCTRCGSSVALDPRPLKKSKPPPAAGMTDCGKCGMRVSQSTKFCPNCGDRIVVPTHDFDIQTKVGPLSSGAQPVAKANVTVPAATPPPSPQPGKTTGRSTLFFGGAVQAARAKLTLIRGDGEDGVSFTLAGRDHHAGRGECPISFPDDTFLSPTHANFSYSSANNELVVRDEGSLNGVFVRIQEPTQLRPGATVLVGEQVLTVVPAPQPEDVPDTEGTYYSSSMPRPCAIEVRQQLRGGQLGWVFRPTSDVVTLGREGNDINFPEDPFISGRHAELRLTGGVLSVSDLGSRNGTFVRIDGERVLKHGDYVFLGQQLLRVEIV
jgi:pSer/pThr/pTyr-binding forkhead associated (FHA) protein/RNA polymerase subunit RPABC4/transcription elongation factor Spt4